jgi:hypothetical protein
MISRTLDRLIGRVTALSNDCDKAKPRDLKVELLPELDGETDEEEEEDQDDNAE